MLDRVRIRTLREAGHTPEKIASAVGVPSVAKPCSEEPDAGMPHVRICGGPGAATLRGYPITKILLSAGALALLAAGAAPPR